MHVIEEIKKYIASLPEPKQGDMQTLHQFILGVMPNSKLWFLDGKNREGKVVANENIGYGMQTIHYADGQTKAFYQVGISANKTGISVYILGINDKTYLAKTYGGKIGKASITGYCIKFKKLQDINLETLGDAIRFGCSQSE